MSSNNIYPFSGAFQNSSSSSFPFDVVINEAYPGLVLEPTEPNGVYTVFREVSGCAWWAVNADFNSTDNQWEQVSPANAALPAYAIEQCADGTINRYVASATNTPGTAVTWVAVWELDQYGNQTLNPQVATLASQIGQHLEITWNSTLSTQMSATQLDVTDTLSASGSLIENLIVNGTPRWQVRKDGTLVTGIVPFARITGFAIPSGTTIDSPIFTGTSTFNGPIVANSGITANTLHVTGNSQLDGTTTANNLTVTGSVTTTGGTPVVNLESTDGTIAITVPSANTYNLSATRLHYSNPYLLLGGNIIQTSPGVIQGSAATPFAGFLMLQFTIIFTSSGQTITLTGGGTGPGVNPITWNSPTATYTSTAANEVMTIIYTGNCVSGASPSISYSYTGSLANPAPLGALYLYSN